MSQEPGQELRDFYTPRLRDVAAELRPREKLVQLGPDALHLEELLAVIWGTGRRGETVEDLARRVLREYGSRALATLRQVESAVAALGLGPVRACQLVAAVELGRRFFLESPGRLPVLRTPEDVAQHLGEMTKLSREQLRGLYLNSRNRLIHDEVISVGTATANLAHPREVFRPAVEYGAAGIILAHNHPSGSPEPSDSDLQVSRQLAAAAEVMDIDILDHVILAAEGFVSLRERGLLG
ncbi:MAG: DNA repair protein RadC [Deinococcus sp.]|nr:DNA repair protein RadC [Deinococcus sp.]